MLQSTRGALSSRLVCWSLSFLRCCNLAVNQHVEGMQALKDSQTPKKYIQCSNTQSGKRLNNVQCPQDASSQVRLIHKVPHSFSLKVHQNIIAYVSNRSRMVKISASLVASLKPSPAASQTAPGKWLDCWMARPLKSWKGLRMLHGTLYRSLQIPILVD